jgi:hypothetical protein
MWSLPMTSLLLPRSDCMRMCNILSSDPASRSSHARRRRFIRSMKLKSMCPFSILNNILYPTLGFWFLFRPSLSLLLSDLSCFLLCFCFALEHYDHVMLIFPVREAPFPFTGFYLSDLHHPTSPLPSSTRTWIDVSISGCCTIQHFSLSFYSLPRYPRSAPPVSPPAASGSGIYRSHRSSVLFSFSHYTGLSPSWLPTIEIVFPPSFFSYLRSFYPLFRQRAVFFFPESE